MSPELISKVIGLVQNNGDRLVLADSQSGKTVVILDLAAYEQLCGDSVQPKLRTEKSFAEQSENFLEKNQPLLAHRTVKANTGLLDLTQEELLDKINRDIADWKNGQEKKRAQELKAAALGSTATDSPKTAFFTAKKNTERQPLAQKVPAFQAVNALEPEERFYLEPIE